ncbi:antitoxin [Rhizobium sp.]
MNGRSQAVRLPAEFRFEGKEVFIRKDERTGDVILSERSQRQANWDSFIKLREEAIAAGEIDDDFLSPKERFSLPETDRDPFEGWEE